MQPVCSLFTSDYFIPDTKHWCENTKMYLRQIGPAAVECIKETEHRYGCSLWALYGHCTKPHTCLSELSAIIWIIQIYNSILCTSTKQCLGKLLLLTSIFDGGLVISAEITSRPLNRTTPTAYFSPCTLAQSSFQQNKDVKLHSGLAQHFSV
jgi:hypothetical protein